MFREQETTPLSIDNNHSWLRQLFSANMQDKSSLEEIRERCNTLLSELDRATKTGAVLSLEPLIKS
jgi:hypothetical protein